MDHPGTRGTNVLDAADRFALVLLPTEIDPHLGTNDRFLGRYADPWFVRSALELSP
jgi:hypothetical protein